MRFKVYVPTTIHVVIEVDAANAMAAFNKAGAEPVRLEKFVGRPKTIGVRDFSRERKVEIDHGDGRINFDDECIIENVETGKSMTYDKLSGLLNEEESFDVDGFPIGY
jgi:hypothetical protein